MTDETKPERNERGHFLKGVSGNPAGRSPRTVEQAALEKFRSHFRNGNFEEVLTALQNQARRGNVRAIELIFEYLIGKPAQSIDIQSDNNIRVLVVHERRDNNAA